MAKFRVHVYPVVRVGLNVEAPTPEAAVRKALDQMLDLNDLFNKEYAESQEHLVVEFADDFSDNAQVDLEIEDMIETIEVSHYAPTADTSSIPYYEGD